MYSKTAIILAGGKGTRLRPYTIAIPKPLVPIGSRPILEIIVSKLVEDGFDRIVVTVNHQADLIKAYFGDGRKWGCNIEYSLEEKPLGTMGPLTRIKNLPEYFLVMNGDILSDIDYGTFLRKHILSKRIFTISSYDRIEKVDYGVLEAGGGILQGFKEKPQIQYTVSMGVYAMSREVLTYIPPDEYYGFDMLMLKLLSVGCEIGVDKYSGYWMDIGRPEDYEQAIKDMETGRIKI